jgi:Domain of unknown function (DUF4350)
MKAFQTDARILIAAVMVIVLLAIIAVVSAPNHEAPPLSVRSDARDGAAVLQQWIERSGYDVQELTNWEQLNELQVLFVLDPIIGYHDEDIRLLHDWVRRGHTLIVAGYPRVVNGLLAPFNLYLDYVEHAETANPAAPTLRLPPFRAVNMDAIAQVQIADRTQQPSAVFHLYAGQSPILASLDVDRGQIWVSGATEPFTNQGLRDPGSAAMVANLMANIPRSAMVGFDELSHGFGSASQQSIVGWLISTAPGWGILTGFAMTMIYLALRGRHFGRSVPLPEERLRRESAEYIHAMAALFRRSGQRRAVLKHYEQQFRRALSERYGLDPKANAAELVNAVVYYDPAVDEVALRRLLEALNADNVNEQELVQTVSVVDQFLRTIH